MSQADHPEGRKLIAPPVTPESLYLQDKRWRDWNFKEQAILREIRTARVRGFISSNYECAELADIERRFTLVTDDPEEAFNELRRQRATGAMGWDMAEVRHMTVPPRTFHRYCVFRDVRKSQF